MNLTTEARRRVIASINKGEVKHLTFSDRLAVADEFNVYCAHDRIKSCPENFLSWLATNDTGKNVIKLLSEEVKQDAIKAVQRT
jgi:hypothetical protein